MADDDVKVGSNAWALKMNEALNKVDAEENPEFVASAVKLLEQHGFGAPAGGEGTGFGGMLVDQDVGAEIEEVAPKESPRGQMGRTEALKLGLAQGATLGFGEEVEAGVASLAGEDVNRVLGRGIEAELDPRTPYEAVRDELRAKLDQAVEERPAEYVGGEMLGGVIPGFVAGSATVPGKVLPKLFGKAATGRRAERVAERAVTAEKGFKARLLDGLKETAAVGTSLGAATGLGISEFDQGIGSVAADVGIQGGLGLLGSGLSGLAGEVGTAMVPRPLGRAAQTRLLSQDVRGPKAVEYAKALEAGAAPQVVGARGGVNYGEDMSNVLSRAQKKGTVSSVELARDDTVVHLLPVLKGRLDAVRKGTNQARYRYYDSVGSGAPINMQPIADDMLALMQSADEGVFSGSTTRKLKPLYDSLFKDPVPGEVAGTAAERSVTPRGRVTGLGGAEATAPTNPRVVKELDIKVFDDSLEEIRLMIKDTKYEKGLQAKLITIRDAMMKLRKKQHPKHARNMEQWGERMEAEENSIRALGMNPDKNIADFARGKRPEEMSALRNNIKQHAQPGTADSRASKELEAIAANDPALRKLLNTNRGLEAMDKIKFGDEGSPLRIVASPKGGVSGYGAATLGDKALYRAAGMKSASGYTPASKLGGALAAQIDQDMAAAVTDEKMEEFYKWVIEAQADGRDLNPDELRGGER